MPVFDTSVYMFYSDDIDVMYRTVVIYIAPMLYMDIICIYIDV